MQMQGLKMLHGGTDSDKLPTDGSEAGVPTRAESLRTAAAALGSDGGRKSK
jgi:hypothetical protein